jgi:hypothetical protein
LGLSVTETLLIFVGIPAAVIAAVAALSLAGRRSGGAKRYRPGRPFDFTPVWFLARPEQLADSAGAALTAGAQAPALTSGTIETAGAVAPVRGTGGASDRW